MVALLLHVGMNGKKLSSGGKPDYWMKYRYFPLPNAADSC